MVRAFRELVRQILMQPAAVLEAWKLRLLEAVGGNGRVLIDLVPELELVLGPQPEVAALDAAQAKNRFWHLVQHFVRAFAGPEHPLCLFLDDLQWADPASLEMLELLLGDPDSKHLLVIGAYRDNQVDAAHPLPRTLDGLRKRGAVLTELRLPPLGVPTVVQIAADTLRARPSEVLPLAALVAEKTGGNPFFLGQFLATIHDQGLLSCDPHDGTWTWDLPRIRESVATDNVIDLMLAKLQRLAPGTQRVLELAACIGHEFDLRTLSTIDERRPDETAAELWPALRDGLVMPLDGDYRLLDVSAGAAPAEADFAIGYRFLHDRVLQAAYALIAQDRKQGVHRRIGRLLLDKSSGSPSEDLFEIVNHLNLGAVLITEPAERRQLARLNLAAGKKAKTSAAYQAAADYFAAGLALVDEASRDQAYELCFALYTERAECEVLCGAFDQARSLLDAVGAFARTDADRAHVATIGIVRHIALGQTNDAMRLGIETLRRFGIELFDTEAARETALQAQLAEIERNLAGRRIEDLIHTAPMTDADLQAASKLMVSLTAPVFTAMPKLACLLIANQVNWLLKYGTTEVSSYTYGLYGFLLAIELGRCAEARAFGELALAANAALGHDAMTCKVNYIVGMFAHFTMPLRSVLPYFERSYQAGLSSGDIVNLSYSCLHHVIIRFACGDDLGEVREEAERGLTLMRHLKSVSARVSLTVVHQAMANLQRRTRGRDTLSDGVLGEDQLLEELASLQRSGRPFAICLYYTVKLQLAVLYRNYPVALAMLARAEAQNARKLNLNFATEIAFYASLAILALLKEASPDDAQRLSAQLAVYTEEVAERANTCPENYRHKHVLVQAEQARVLGDDAKALELYDRAIVLAKEHGFSRDEALANELCAGMYMALGRPKAARSYLEDAYLGYRRWGATAKAEALLEDHAQLKLDLTRRLRTADLAATASVISTTVLGQTTADSVRDAALIVRAVQTITGEREVPRIVERLATIVLENAGAERGALVLGSGGLLCVAASFRAEPGSFALEPSAPLAGRSDLPHSVLLYVARTQESVVIDDARTDTQFAADPYIAASRPRSLLCLPLVYQGRLSGALYLERRDMAGAFNTVRVELLGLLSTQAAIAIESARFLAQEHAARAAAEEAGRRSAFLAEASALLSESLDHERVLARFAKLAVPGFADWCVIDLIHDGELRRVASEHADVDKQPLLAKVERCGDRLRARVLETRAPVLLPEVTEATLRPLCDGAEHVRLVQALGMRSAIAAPLVAHGNLLGVISLARAQARYFEQADLESVQDIADRAAIAIEHAQLYRQAQEAIRLRDEFFCVAAHELNTPIAVLMLNLGSLSKLSSTDSRNAAMRTKLVALAAHQGQRLTRLVRDMLDVTRLERGLLQQHAEAVDLAGLARDVIAGFSSQLAAARCDVSLEAEAPVQGHWDPMRIEQVVLNLLSNAAKFGAGKPIAVRVAAIESRARLSITDHGIGIEPSLQARIFDPFERAVSAKHYGGLGLGLYICRRIVEAHGGSIRVASRPGCGATFVVDLPLGISAG
jgi:predicted ATPase/signal transduction histidine kinase